MGTSPGARYQRAAKTLQTLADVKLDGVDLSGFDFNGLEFLRCSFVGATLTGATFHSAVDCDFCRSVGESVTFNHIDRSRFNNARLKSTRWVTHLDGADFTGGEFEGAVFSESFWASAVTPRPAETGPVFARATLKRALFDGLRLASPDFSDADLTGSYFSSVRFKNPVFRGANLDGSSLVGCTLPGADFTRASLTGENLGEVDLTDAIVTRADLAGSNLRGATLVGVDLSGARNFDPRMAQPSSAGPSLTSLNKVAAQAKQIRISFHLADSAGGVGMPVNIHTYGGRKAGASAHSSLPGLHDKINLRPQGVVDLTAELLQLGNSFGHQAVLLSTVGVESTKSPTSGKQLHDLVVNSIAEAFGQTVPPADELAAATKAWREQLREQQAADQERREASKKQALKQETTAKKQIAKKIAREVGQVTDIATFLKAIELRIEKPKIDKATRMLKAERFKLFNDITDDHIAGVVKSQTDPDLVYACRVSHEGHYACCTQNLNICGGLRGSVCKHLLVLIIGLVKAGELDPTTIDAWLARTHDVKAELDKELMGDIFIRYKGAEAGEVDWRPTETVPEDYYAL